MSKFFLLDVFLCETKASNELKENCATGKNNVPEKMPKEQRERNLDGKITGLLNEDKEKGKGEVPAKVA